MFFASLCDGESKVTFLGGWLLVFTPQRIFLHWLSSDGEKNLGQVRKSRVFKKSEIYWTHSHQWIFLKCWDMTWTDMNNQWVNYLWARVLVWNHNNYHPNRTVGSLCEITWRHLPKLTWVRQALHMEVISALKCDFSCWSLHLLENSTLALWHVP